MIINLYIDAQQDRESDYVNADVEGLHTGSSSDHARLLAMACHQEEQLKPVVFKSVIHILHQDGHLDDQDLYFYTQAIDECNYEVVLDVMQFMER